MGLNVQSNLFNKPGMVLPISDALLLATSTATVILSLTLMLQFVLMLLLLIPFHGVGALVLDTLLLKAAKLKSEVPRLMNNMVTGSMSGMNLLTNQVKNVVMLV